MDERFSDYQSIFRRLTPKNEDSIVPRLPDVAPGILSRANVLHENYVRKWVFFVCALPFAVMMEYVIETGTWYAFWKTLIGITLALPFVFIGIFWLSNKVLLLVCGIANLPLHGLTSDAPASRKLNFLSVLSTFIYCTSISVIFSSVFYFTVLHFGQLLWITGDPEPVYLIPIAIVLAATAQVALMLARWEEGKVEPEKTENGQDQNGEVK